MFKSTSSLGYVLKDASLFSKLASSVSAPYIQNRNTYILKRKYKLNLQKKGEDYFRLKGKDYVYELEERVVYSRKPDVQVVLKTYVEGLGHSGDVVSVKRDVAYNKLLITGMAEYATPEALERANKPKEEDDKNISLLTALRTVGYLERQVLSVVMNKEAPWTIKPWHVRVSFRKAGIHVPEKCMILPEKPISGPDFNLEGKIFCVTVVIDNSEKVNVRCRIHHWGATPQDRVPFVKDYWTLPPETIFPSDAEKLKLPVSVKESNTTVAR